MTKERGNLKRFAALLLFQFRKIKDGCSNRRRVCEERIILFETNAAIKALSMAENRGRDEEFSYIDDGVEIRFEFIGIIELVELGQSLDSDEVWWRLYEKMEPMERRDKLIPNKLELSAFKTKVSRKRGRVIVGP